MKTFLKLFSYMTTIVVMIVVSVVFASQYYETVDVDKQFRGLKEQMNQGNKDMHVVIVHGIGRHCIGYSQKLVTGILRNFDIDNIEYKYDCRKIEEKDVFLPVTSTFEEDIRCIEFDGCEIVVLRQSISAAVIGPDRLKTCDNKAELDVKLIGESPEGVARRIVEEDLKCTRSSTVGYIWTREYAYDDDNVIKFYEITWDPATRWSKTDYVDATDVVYSAGRNIFNARIKDTLINQSIADAVLYLGDYQLVMQYPLIMGFCKVVGHNTDVGSVNKALPGAVNQSRLKDKVFSCDPGIIASKDDAESFDDHNSISIITHSLGTRMMFDVLGYTANQDSLFNDLISRLGIPAYIFDNVSAEDKKHASEVVRESFISSVDNIFAFANQVPLLELSNVSSPVDKIHTRFDEQKSIASLGSDFESFVGERTGFGRDDKISIVSFTDENDLLSYNLKCWYYKNVIRYQNDINYKDISFTAWDEIEDEQQRQAQFNELKQHPYFSCESDRSEQYWKNSNLLFSNVTYNLPKFSLPTLMSDPIGAHDGYFKNETVYSMVACGGTVDGAADC